MTSAVDDGSASASECTLREAVALANGNTVNPKDGCMRDTNNYNKAVDIIVFDSTFNMA